MGNLVKMSQRNDSCPEQFSPAICCEVCSGCYAQSPIILYLKGCNNNASEAFFQVRSDKPSYKHNPKKSSVQSIFLSAMHVNKTYLVLLMY